MQEVGTGINEGIMSWWQESLLSVHGMFLGFDVPSFQSTPWMEARVAVDNRCICPVNIRFSVHIKCHSIAFVCSCTTDDDL